MIKTGMKSRILIVEDEEKLRRVLSLQLESAGYEAVLAGSAEEALKLAERVNLVLTDLRLPAMDGMSLLPKTSEMGLFLIMARLPLPMASSIVQEDPPQLA